jgi:hypothetical protein
VDPTDRNVATKDDDNPPQKRGFCRATGS